MINLMNRIAGFAGLVMLTGAAAFGQSEMKIDVPFTFHTSQATMAPGTYTITPVAYAGSAPVYRLRNAETRKSILVVAPMSVRRAADDKDFGAKADFMCAGEYCALSAIYNLSNPSGNGIPVQLKNAPRGEKVASVSVPARF